jgi:hypothetical protein
MNAEHSDFITNIANSSSEYVIERMHKAAEYFKDDPDVQGKCTMMHHAIVVSLIADYLMVMKEMSRLPRSRLSAMLMEDAKNLIRRIENERADD